MSSFSIDISNKPVLVNATAIGIDLKDNVSLLKFQKAWDLLAIDPYVSNCVNPRLRKHCRFKFDKKKGTIQREADGPYFQTSENNPLYGGIQRKFSPVDLDFFDKNPWFGHLLKFNMKLIPVSYNEVLINCHFVRITSLGNVAGEPAPEGMHHDGFEYISIHLINKHNCRGGETIVADKEDNIALRHTLINPFDSLYLNDTIFKHYTSPIHVERENIIATRDMLLCSYEHYSNFK